MYLNYLKLRAKMTEPKMDYTFLGNSGLKVSNVCLGTMTFGKASNDKGMMSWFFQTSRQVDEPTSHKIMDKYVELGGNFIDTADIYSYGNSERIIGNWVESRKNRDDVVLATKVRFMMDSDSKNRNGLSRRHIVKSCEDSLERLKTDYIDLYQCHMWDNAVPLDETLRTLDDLVRCGKIRYYGYSNVGGWQMQKVVDTAKEYGFTKCISLQQQYSLLSRGSEYEPFMVCKNEGIGVIPWSPLKSGMLTSKFERNKTPDASESRTGMMYERTKQSTASNWGKLGNDDQYWKLIDLMKDIAKAHGKSVPQVALRWLIQKPVVASVIIGVTSLAQLEDNCGAASGWELTAEEMKQLDEASDVPKEYPYEMVWGSSNSARYNPFYRDSLKY